MFWLRNKKSIFHLARPPDKECVLEKHFLHFSPKTYVVGTQKNRLNEMVIFEHPKHMFKLMGKAIITV